MYNDTQGPFSTIIHILLKYPFLLAAIGIYAVVTWAMPIMNGLLSIFG